ncbi:hypothetical protein CEQ90_03740 [Lewinellaceae bacterium SD302]|nr:hypothetical protein CEQ90_03740 [Lewinellaceae bacterium SD302]
MHLPQLRYATWVVFIAAAFSLLFSSCNEKQGDYLNVLVFSKTAGYRHASIDDGKAMFEKMAEDHQFKVEFSEDAKIFNRQNLSRFNVIVFLSTTGDILEKREQQALEAFVKAGGGWMGIHAAADTEYDWPWYNRLVGAYFESHPNDPNVRDADILVLDKEHPATAHLPDTWERSDEWYNYKDIQNFEPLLRLDETSYEGGTNGDNHPISWYNEFDGGRMFYTGLGHTKESFVEDNFVQHVWGGLQYVAGPKRKLDFSKVAFAPEDNRFNVEAMVTGMFEPMEMELLPDGRPLWIQRRGEIMVYDFDIEGKMEVNKLDVWTKHEDGMLGVALDPDFEDNNWFYLYYSPNIEESINRLSRFKWNGDGIDLETEQIILDVPVDRNECCHSGGSLEFGPNGYLHLSIGDNTNPFDSEGFAPIDDSKEKGNWDARRSASNTMDLRGKILRIKVEEDGSYTTPADNLFPDGKGGRPEIYVMGCRNPFRISVDQQTGTVYWGDVGPDAGKDSTVFGPRGHCEVNYAPTAGYYGWPLFVADNKAYKQRDFTNDTGGEAFDPMKPINDSRYNTGARELPPARPAMVFYPYAPSEEFPQVGEGGRNPMAGPIFHREDYPDSEHVFPEYYDGKFFFYEWMRDWVMAAELDEEGKVTSFERFMPDQELRHPMDMLMGPDGSLYILEYGPLWFKENKDARLLRIRYNAGNRPPVPAMAVTNSIGGTPFKIQANIGDSEDYDGDELKVMWMLDGVNIGEEPELDYETSEKGVRTLTMQLDDGQGNLVTESRELVIGNNVPDLNIDVTGNRSFYFAEAGLNYAVKVNDAEDGNLENGIDPEAVTVSLDYVEGEDLIAVEYGHQTSTEATQFGLGKNLIADSDCASCHQEKVDNIGPSYEAVAKKYRSKPDAVAYLSNKIINGGGGVWGEQAMAAHPQLSDNEASQMAEYILSLAGPPADGKKSLPLVAKRKLDQHRDGIPGRYYFKASYTDKGAAGDLPRLTTRETIVLRSPRIPAVNYTASEKVLAFTLEGDQNPMGEGSVELLIPSHEGWVTYGDLDLTGIGNLEISMMLDPERTEGGTIELRSGNPADGELIGSVTIEHKPENFGFNLLNLELDESKIPAGVQPVYLSFKASSGRSEGMLGALINLEFKPQPNLLSMGK